LKKKSFNHPPPRPSPVKKPKPSSAPPKRHVEYYPIEQLKEKSIPNLDYTKTENYIAPEDFQALFGMGSEEFHALKGWKKKQLPKRMLTVKYCLVDFFRQGGTPLTLSPTRAKNGVKNGRKGLKMGQN